MTGERDYAERGGRSRSGRGPTRSYQAFPFLDDFPLALAAADAVVARAGGSVAEILARGVPSLLVPVPARRGRPSDQERPRWWQRPARRW